MTAANRKFLPFVIYALIVFCPSAEAQQPKTNARIGFLGATSAAVEGARIEASATVYANWGMWKGKTLSSSGGGLRAN